MSGSLDTAVKPRYVGLPMAWVRLFVFPCIIITKNRGTGENPGSCLHCYQRIKTTGAAMRWMTVLPIIFLTGCIVVNRDSIDYPQVLVTPPPPDKLLTIVDDNPVDVTSCGDFR